MKYMVMIYISEMENDSLSREDLGSRMAAYGAYRQALVDAGAFVTGAPLEKSTTATTLSIRDGQRQVQDGPYADTKEQFGGFFMIECADANAALEWAARCPGAQHGIVEVRPVTPMPPQLAS